MLQPRSSNLKISGKAALVIPKAPLHVAKTGPTWLSGDAMEMAGWHPPQGVSLGYPRIPASAPPCPENSNMQQKRWRKPKRNQHIPEERSLLTWHSLAIWKTQGTLEKNLRKIDLKLQIKMIYINILGIMHRYKLGRPVQVSGTPLSINSVMNHL